MLGFKPKITLIGPLDSAIPVELSDDALATLRESLSNVVRTRWTVGPMIRPYPPLPQLEEQPGRGG